ncbi:Mitochondrial import inner membrane translocase [Fasciola hepatica]|uniref:Mitochondrial import inner membrane translocase n=1 Tax=Fasciola hepatica TaxID=6192 RepID=A0A4E0R3R7_FASHE|nr:Mitochondrial import inner membrane translocase [Fasciola hepatica]
MSTTDCSLGMLLFFWKYNFPDCYLLSYFQAKYLAQLIISGARVLGRAFTQALKEEYTASQQAAQARRNQYSSDSDQRTYDQLSGISIDEAKQILNVKDIHDAEAVRKQYDHLFSVNAKEKGGSLYLQSKVFRAKERIDEELQYEHEKLNKNDKSDPPPP